jgi:hypothetical protein
MTALFSESNFGPQHDLRAYPATYYPRDIIASLQHSTHTVACTPPKEAEICKSTFSTRRVRHKAQPSAEDSGRCIGAAARWLITPKRPGATCGAGEEYQEKYGPHGLPARFPRVTAQEAASHLELELRGAVT